jgi:(4S)-4-hydroxy-5-phosphonooxypentane-2,3-dione isomerase
MLAMIVKVRIKPEERERFLAGIEDDAICSERDEPGCLRFNVLQDRADENVYYFLEIYRDEAALAAHRETPHYARWMETRAATVESAERIETNTVIPRDPAYWG